MVNERGNKMTELMQMTIDKLGVKVGEIFKIKDEDGELLYGNYYINESGIMINANHESRIGVLWQPLLSGEYQIVKLPFKPTYKESYRYISCDGSDYTTSWSGTLVDYYRFNAKNCFPMDYKITPKDKERILNEMKGVYHND